MNQTEKLLSVKIDANLHQQFNSACQKQGKNMTSVIKDLIISFIEQTNHNSPQKTDSNSYNLQDIERLIDDKIEEKLIHLDREIELMKKGFEGIRRGMEIDDTLIEIIFENAINLKDLSDDVIIINQKINSLIPNNDNIEEITDLDLEKTDFAQAFINGQLTMDNEQ